MEHHTYYEALVRRDATYEGTFFVASRRPASFAVRRVRHENRKRRTVSFLRRRKRHYLPLIDRAVVVIRLLIPEIMVRFNA